MKPAITRWKTVPSYSRRLVVLPVSGSVHSRAPSASSTKLRTVFGAWSGNSRTLIRPRLVWKVAVSVVVMAGILARLGTGRRNLPTGQRRPNILAFQTQGGEPVAEG